MVNNKTITEFSEMTVKEREFVLECINGKKPKKILEIGIAAGANSVLILDFLEKHDRLKSTTFYAVDYNEVYYRDLNWGGGGKHPKSKKKWFFS